jgi:hypothetical protein
VPPVCLSVCGAKFSFTVRWRCFLCWLDSCAIEWLWRRLRGTRQVFIFIANDKGASWAYATPGFGAALAPDKLQALREVAGAVATSKASKQVHGAAGGLSVCLKGSNCAKWNSRFVFFLEQDINLLPRRTCA